MGDLLYPTIPDPISTTESLLETAVALKQAVELLNGQRAGTGTTKAVTPADLKYIFGTPLPPGAVPPPVDTSGVSAALAAARASVQLALLELRNTVENSITDIQNEQQTALTEFQLLLDEEEVARINGDATIQSQVDAIVITNNEGAIAAITTETAARITADDALAGQITTVSATVAGNTAAISSEAVTRASQDAALATQINNISAVTTTQHVFTQSTPPVATQVGDIWIDVAQGNLLKVWDGSAWVARDDNRMDINAAAISTEQTVRADADVAIANQLNTITTQVDDNSAAITSEQLVRADADDALAADIDTLSASVGSNQAAIANEAFVRASADSTFTGQISTLTAQTNTNAASIVNEAALRTSADTAIANNVSTLSTTVAGHTASITTQQTSLNGLLAEYSVELNANGHIAGYRINSGGPLSEFIVQADKFKIVQNTGGVLLQPFTVLAGNTYINRVIVNQEIISSNYAQDVSGNPTLGFRAGSDGLLRAYDARFVNLQSIGGTFTDLTADEATFIDFTAHGGTISERPLITAQPTFRNGVPEGLAQVYWDSPGNIEWVSGPAWGIMVCSSLHRTPDSVQATLSQADGAGNYRAMSGAGFMVPHGKTLPPTMPGFLAGDQYIVEWLGDGTIVRTQYTANGAVSTSSTARGKWMYDAERDPLNLDAVNKVIAGLGFSRWPQPIRVPEFLAGGVTPVTSVTFKCWGAAGGKDDGGGRSGPGGYVAGTFAVGAKGSAALIKRGEILWLMPGEGGRSLTQDVIFGYGGSGQAQQRRSSGGGLSGVFLHSITRANMLLCAGGGGAGEGGQSGGPGGAAASGGNGVSLSAADDEIMTGLPWTFDGTNSKGGGGGGRVGGGWLTASGGNAGGKGGTNFIHASATSTTNSAAAVSANGNASTDTPPNTADGDWSANQYCLGNLARVASGKTSPLAAQTGGNGLIVVTYA